MILSAQTIQSRGLISPFHQRTVVNGMTYGLGPCGYDVRVQFDALRDIPDMYLSPGEFKLAATVEYFMMPDDVVGVVHDKSSWARKGLAVQNTVIEPGWCGYLTLELTNHGNSQLHILIDMPIAQIIFHQLDKPTLQPYSGKYQNQQAGPVEAIDE